MGASGAKLGGPRCVGQGYCCTEGKRESQRERERVCMCVCLCVCLLEQMGAYSLDIFFMTRTVCEAQKSLFRCDAKSIFNLFMW